MHSRYRDKHVLNHKVNFFNLRRLFKRPFSPPSTKQPTYLQSSFHIRKDSYRLAMIPSFSLIFKQIALLYFKTTLNRIIVSKITPRTQETTKHSKLIHFSILSCTINARNTHYAKVQTFLLAQIMTDTDMAIKGLGLSETDAFTKAHAR